MTPLSIRGAGDGALLVEWPARIDPATSEEAVALADTVRQEFRDRVRDVVVGYCSVTIYFDPLQTDVETLEATIQAASRSNTGRQTDDRPVIDVPVCYGGACGPDLPDVAAFAGGSTEDVVAWHSETTYRVYVVGFVPGFPYMASVDPRIAVPRRASPRTRVPEGSVAVAAGQTGIYPMETPGGWHLIGRTRVKPYDPNRPEPFLFRPGDRVRFRPIEHGEFERGA